jgi:hypothetical protein
MLLLDSKHHHFAAIRKGRHKLRGRVDSGSKSIHLQSMTFNKLSRSGDVHMHLNGTGQIPHTKDQLKWINDFSERPKTVKLLEENTGDAPFSSTFFFF